MCSRWHRFHTLSVPFLAPISTTHLLKAALYLYQCVPISHRQVSIKCAAYFPAVAVKTETGAQMSSFPSRKNSKLAPPAPPPLLRLLCRTTLKVTAHLCAIIECCLNSWKVQVWATRLCKLAEQRSNISLTEQSDTPLPRLIPQSKKYVHNCTLEAFTISDCTFIIHCVGEFAWMCSSVPEAFVQISARRRTFHQK